MRLILLTLAVPTVFNPVCIQRIFKGITQVLNGGLAKSSCRPPQILFHAGIRLSALKTAGEEGDVLEHCSLFSMRRTLQQQSPSHFVLIWHDISLSGKHFYFFYFFFLAQNISFYWIKCLITSWWQNYTVSPLCGLLWSLCVCLSSTQTQTMPDSPYRNLRVLHSKREPCHNYWLECLLWLCQFQCCKLVSH